MGSLPGHLIPGSFFMIFSIWWSYLTSIRYFQAKSKKKYHATVTMPCICLPCSKLRRLPIESYFKLIFSLIGLMIEFIFGFENVMPQVNSGEIHHTHNHNKRDDHMNMKVLTFTKNNLQHMLMYLSFLLGSIIEILLSNRSWLPLKLDYIFGAVSFLIEALLFIFHLHGRSVLDIHIHTLLVISILGCLLFTCLEMYDSKEILFTFGRIGCTLLQGLWFCQAGFILYPPIFLIDFFTKHNLNITDEHEIVMTVTALYCFNILGVMFYMIIMGYCVKKIFIDLKLFESQWDDLLLIDNGLSLSKSGQSILMDGFMPLNHHEDDDNEL